MEFITYILGSKSISFFLAGIVFLVLGQLINKIITYNFRAVEAPFNFIYWIKDNWIDLSASTLVGFVTIRFTSDIIMVANKFAGIDLHYIVDSMFYYLVLGLFYQTILHWSRKKLSFIRSSKNSIGDIRATNSKSVIRPNTTPISKK